MSLPAWKICLAGVPLETAENLAQALELEHEASIQAAAIDIENEDEGVCRLEFYGTQDTDPETLRNALAGLVSRYDLPGIRPDVVEIEDKDWVSVSQAGLVPVRAGRFFVHGSHDHALTPPGGVPIEINAAQAFGTGHHATTQGCLMAFDALLKRCPPRRVLDLGCGSGVLAIAAALATRRPVTASDVDPLAVRIANENAASNSAGSLVRAVIAAGTKHRAIQAASPYDLVFANILARPLQALAPEIASVLAPGGRAILSGLTPGQEAGVIAAYRLQGLRLADRLRRDNWSTLTIAG